MTREPEVCDWCPEPATKRIEDVRGYETAVACDGCVKYGIRYVLPINDPRCGDRHDGDDGEAGVREPSGDSPDSPATGGPGLPGPGPEPVPAKVPGGDPLIAWPVVLKGAEYEPVWEGGVELNPDGTWHSWETSLAPANQEAKVPL